MLSCALFERLKHKPNSRKYQEKICFDKEILFETKKLLGNLTREMWKHCLECCC